MNQQTKPNLPARPNRKANRKAAKLRRDAVKKALREEFLRKARLHAYAHTKG